MKRAFTAVLPFVALGLVLGCAGSEDTFRSTVAKRASFDMGCQQVSVQNIGGDSFGATGCERKASYSCVCTYHVWSVAPRPCVRSTARPRHRRLGDRPLVACV